jgi:hypothetical protein
MAGRTLVNQRPAAAPAKATGAASRISLRRPPTVFGSGVLGALSSVFDSTAAAAFATGCSFGYAREHAREPLKKTLPGKFGRVCRSSTLALAVPVKLASYCQGRRGP